MGLLELKIVKVVLGLLCFMFANNIMGALKSMFDGTFDKKKFFKGVLKALVILTTYILVYVGGMINPDLIGFNINGQEMNMITALESIAIAGYLWYGAQALAKLVTVLRIKEKKPELEYDINKKIEDEKQRFNEIKK